jgi:eukaryotic-like serine/threonine-protein kinase
MTLDPGVPFGPYAIIGVLGEGGMGTVYRAHDAKLNRDVAIKVLLPAVANDPERLARFSREAHVLAALNHPNIAHIYGVEEAGGVRGLVMELVDGATLADRVANGALPLDEALPIVRQIAEALQAAHDRGVIHRDLKPANIKLQPDGTVKVLDFGLAKAVDVTAASLDGGPTVSPTITSPAMMTGIGTLLGTAAYMSPEQARGQPADKRSDIWAFGCVVYEMLTAHRAFVGDDVIDTLAAVRHKQPDWTLLPSQLSAALGSVLRRCLEKDRQRRLADISTVAFVLDDLARGAERGSPVTGRTRPRFRVLAATTLGVAVLAGVAGFAVARLIQPAPARNGITRFTIPLPARQRFTNAGRQVLALSPDGRRLVYVANGRLWIHSLDERDARALTDVDVGGIVTPAFSPDGRSVVFWRSGALSKVPAAGGTPVRVAMTGASPPFGVTWSSDEILFADFPGGPNTRSRVMRVSAEGGTPEIVAEAAPGDLFYGPQRLPGGAILVTVAKTVVNAAFLNRWDQARIAVRLPSGDERTIVPGGSDGRYVAPDHLVYAVGGIVFALPFDVSRLQPTGPALAVIEGVSRASPATGAAQMAISSSGTLAYIPGPASMVAGTNRSLALFARDGNATPLPVPADAYEFPRVSPASDRIVVATNDGRDNIVWLYDLAGLADRRRLTIGGRNRFPIWSADGQRIAFQSDRDGDRGIFWQAIAGGGAERLTRADVSTEHIPGAWSADRGTLLFEVAGNQTYALWAYSLATRTTAPLGDIRSRTPITPAFSPDGKWLTYHTQEFVSADDTSRGVRDTVWVRPYPFTNDLYPVASEGTSHHPVWSRDGHELIYIIGAGQIVSRDITLTPSFSVGKSRLLESLLMPTQPPGALARSFDTLAGGRIVSDSDPLLQPDGSSATARTTEIDIVLNWLDELSARVPRHR